MFIWTIRVGRNAAVIQNAGRLCQTDITCDTGTFRALELRVEVLSWIEFIIVHWEELKAWGCNRLEGLRVEEHDWRLVFCIFLKYLLIVFAFGVRLQDHVSLVQRVYFYSAKTFWLDDGVELRHVEFAIVGGKTFGSEV